MSYIEDLNAITTPSLTDLLYIYQNGADFKITNQQLLDLIKTNTVIPITQSDYDDLTPAEKNNGSIYIITDGTITAADVKYSSGVSVGDVLDIQTNTSVLSASFTANSSNATNTVLSDDINLVKGLYLISIAIPVMSVSTFSVQVVGTNITKYGSLYPKMREQTTMTFLLSVNGATDTICLKSAESTAVTFTYLDRGGIFAYRLA